jgi:pyrroline-5-carboxylate reductase
MKILIIGGGNMGQSFAKSFLHNHIADVKSFSVLEKDSSKEKDLSKIGIGNIHQRPGAYIEKYDLVVLAVKPQAFSDLAIELAHFISDEQVVLSIMAGISIDLIKSSLGINKIIRAMPNMASQIGEGMTVFTSSEEVSRIELVTVQNLLESTGKNLYVADESLINAGTAISGSGPAYVLYFMQAIMESAIELGFTMHQAEMLTYQTFKGIVEFFQSSKNSCSEMIQKVASEGGTTEAALKMLEKEQVNKAINKAIKAANQRAIELGESK